MAGMDTSSKDKISSEIVVIHYDSVRPRYYFAFLMSIFKN
jgi:hypothetical protein